MLSKGIINKPLSCSRCKCAREKHGTLSKLLLTCDMMPDGGRVHVELLERQRIEKRRRRFAGSLEEDAVVPEVEVMVLKEGDGRAIANGDDVLCHYDVFVKSTMQKFESSRDGAEFRFRVGAGSVVPGFEQGVVGANVGGRRRIFIPSQLAFGAREINGERNVDVVFDVEVLAVMSS